MRRLGMRVCPSLAPYVDSPTRNAIGALIADEMPWGIDLDDIKRLRDRWPRRLVAKGVLDGAEASDLAGIGVDGLWVSNHGGRQLDASPSSLDALATVRTVVGPDMPLVFDSGVRTGLDIARAYALGADFVFLGRPFLYGCITLDDIGADHVVRILQDELVNTMRLVGANRLADLPERLRNTPRIAD